MRLVLYKLFVSLYYYVVQTVLALLPNLARCNLIRGFFLSPCFRKAGKNIQIGRNVIINCIWNINIEDNVYIAHYCYINGVGGLSIGKGTIISPMCIISTSNHIFDDNGVTHTAKLKETKIGAGTYIAGHSIINAGVTIGNKCKVGGNSIVIHDIADGTFVSGVPAAEVVKSGSVENS